MARHMQTLLLTALRRGEVTGVRVSEVDFAHAVLRLPANRMKANVAFDAALSDPAMAVLQRALALRRAGAAFVFATKAGGLFSDWSRVKRRMDAALGFGDWVMHDFRRGIVTAMAERGLADVATLDAMLAHSATASLGSGAAAVYQKSGMLGSRRKAAAVWSDLLLAEEAEALPMAVE
jgi:integrase